MGKLISIVGNLGAGKTTLTKLLCEYGPFIPYWEKPEERPFQAQFTKDFRTWALANQLDFFLFRCNQEVSIRQSNEIAVMDGGLDQDFHVFTCHIFNKGYINNDEFNLCKRFYHFTRSILPPPDLVIRISIDISTLLQRRSLRGRKIADQDFSIQELSELERLLGAWLEEEKIVPVLNLPFNQEIQVYNSEINLLVSRIMDLLFPTTPTPIQQ